ncbi:hypothetical protein pb186bvf_003242 [Paramecium bursaria]
MKKTIILVHVDFVKSDFRIKTQHLKMKIHTQLDENLFYFNKNLKRIIALSVHDNLILVSHFQTIEFLKTEKYKSFYDEILQLETTLENKSSVFMINRQISYRPSEHNNDFRLPLSSKRLKPLMESMQTLQSISDKIKQRQSSDPFLITQSKNRSMGQNSIQTMTQTNISIKSVRRLQKQNLFSKDEEYYLQNIEECNKEIDQYIIDLKKNLSKEIFSPQYEKIIDYYDQILSTNPIKKVYETNTIASSNISKQLNKLLNPQIRSFKTRQKFGEDYKINKLLYQQNIPHLNSEYQLPRYKIYQFHSLFKVLMKVTVNGKKQQNGINYKTFRNGIEQIQDQTEKIAEGIFQIIDKKCSGILDWRQFLYLMSSIQAKTKEERIDLFIKIADLDRNGGLSFHEVNMLSNQVLQQFVKVQDPSFLDSLSNYFAKMIFETVGVDTNHEISYKQLKEVIKQDHPDADLICLFCGVDSTS